MYSTRIILQEVIVINLEARSNRFNLLPIFKYTLSLACIALVGHTIFVGMTLSASMLKYSSIETLSEKNEFVSTYDSMLNINLAEQSITIQDIIEEREAVREKEKEKEEKDALATNSKLNGIDSYSDNMDIAYAAMLLAVNGTLLTEGVNAGAPAPGNPVYSDLYHKIFNMTHTGGNEPKASCDRSTVTPLRWCGAVDNKCPDGDVSKVKDYLDKSDKWVLVPKGEPLKPGDVRLYLRNVSGDRNHVFIYIGNDLMKKTIKGLINTGATTVSGSLGQRGPYLTDEPWPKSREAYISTYRRIGSDRYTKYWDTGNELGWKNYWKKQ